MGRVGWVVNNNRLTGYARTILPVRAIASSAMTVVFYGILPTVITLGYALRLRYASCEARAMFGASVARVPEGTSPPD